MSSKILLGMGAVILAIGGAFLLMRDGPAQTLNNNSKRRRKLIFVVKNLDMQRHSVGASANVSRNH